MMTKYPSGDPWTAGVSYINCVCLLLGACLPTALVIVSIPKSGATSFLRYFYTVIVTVIGNQLFKEISGLNISLVHQSVVLGIVGLILLQCCNFLAISRLDIIDLIRGEVIHPSDSLLHRLRLVVCLIFNFRGIGTPWQAKRLNAFPKFYFQGGRSNGYFIARQSLVITWQYVLLDIVYTSSLTTPPADTEKLFGHGSEFIYFNATAEQWVGRVIVGIISWALLARVTLDLPYRALSVVSVLIGITAPNDWPPLFGSVFDAYTIRRFWSTFWHQYCRWFLTSVSNFICRDFLRLPRPSLLERYLNITIVFLTSGFIHIVLDSICWAPPFKTPTLAFFGFFAIGIMIEDGVQCLHRLLTGIDATSGKGKIPLWHKLVGYIWVSIWLILTSPWYLYHNTRMPPETKWLVPVSLVKLVGVSAANTLLAGGLILKLAIEGEV